MISGDNFFGAVERRRIPVLIVTGFLGAGKTTFINRLIAGHQNLKLALVENEFGETSIDQDLVEGMRSENIYDLSNGCICCSISNEFSLTLLDLAEKGGAIDYLIIETTGLADLGNVIKPFFNDEDLQKRFLLTGSICVVDASHFQQQLANREQQMQVILSDLIILNKVADVDGQSGEDIHRRLNAYNSSARIVETNYGRTNELMLDSLADEIQGRLEEKLAAPVMFRLVESKRYTTFTHQFRGTVNLTRFKYWFNYFASINQQEIYRIKGILYLQDSPQRMIVQSVGGAVTYQEGSLIPPGEQPMNTLVFIGNEFAYDRIGYELGEYLKTDGEDESQTFPV